MAHRLHALILDESRNKTAIVLEAKPTEATRKDCAMDFEYLLLTVELFIITIIAGVVYDHMQTAQAVM